MNYWEALILSVIEGITEFLPISSTGHLVLAANLLRINQTEFVKSFEIVIQLGAVLAIVALYWKKLVAKNSLKIWLKIVVAFLPTGVLGLALYKVVKNYLIGNEIVTLVALVTGGVLLVIFERLDRDNKMEVRGVEQLSLKQAVGIGLFQSISMIPGVSRSAATIIGGMLLGQDRKSAVEFSFFLALPTMAAASGLDLIKTQTNYSLEEYMILAFGFAGAFITAVIAVKFFVSFVGRHSLAAFGWYRIVVALVFWLVKIS